MVLDQMLTEHTSAWISKRLGIIHLSSHARLPTNFGHVLAPGDHQITLHNTLALRSLTLAQ